MGIQRFFKIRILGHIFADIFGWCSVTNRALIQKIVHDCNIADMIYQPIINFWVCLTHICFREKMMVRTERRRSFVSQIMKVPIG